MLKKERHAKITPGTDHIDESIARLCAIVDLAEIVPTRSNDETKQTRKGSFSEVGSISKKVEIPKLESFKFLPFSFFCSFIPFFLLPSCCVFLFLGLVCFRSHANLAQLQTANPGPTNNLRQNHQNKQNSKMPKICLRNHPLQPPPYRYAPTKSAQSTISLRLPQNGSPLCTPKQTDTEHAQWPRKLASLATEKQHFWRTNGSLVCETLASGHQMRVYFGFAARFFHFSCS